jgi:hypothetical protein
MDGDEWFVDRYLMLVEALLEHLDRTLYHLLLRLRVFGRNNADAVDRLPPEVM